MRIRRLAQLSVKQSVPPMIGDNEWRLETVRSRELVGTPRGWFTESELIHFGRNKDRNAVPGTGPHDLWPTSPQEANTPLRCSKLKPPRPVHLCSRTFVRL